MSELSRVKLSDVATVSTGFAFKGNGYSDEGIRVVRGENVSLGELRWDTIKCWNQPFSQIEKYSLSDGDIVIGMDGSRVGRNRAQIKKSDLPLLLAQRVARVNAKEGYCQDLIAYIIKSSIFEQYVTRVHTGTSIPHISQKQIEDFSFDIITDYTTQTAIAEILSSLDDKIELNNKINQELENLAQTLFKRWFIDFEFPNENGEPYKSSGGEMVDSELGEIPKGWSIDSLDNIADFLNGLALQKFPPENEFDFLPVIKIKELRQKNTSNSDKASNKIPEKYIIQNGDVLFSWSGSLMVDFWTNGNGALNQHLFKVTSNKFPKWYYYLWTKFHLIEFIKIAESKATTMGHIQRQHLSDAKVLIPLGISEYTLTFEPIISKIICNRIENVELTNLRDTLLPKLISGELEVQQVLSQTT
jgi:type I restriction enzyme S subunit